VRVLIIAEADLGGAISGTERVVAGHASELARRGHEVTVLAFGSQSGPSTGTAGGAVVHRLTRTLRSPWALARRLAAWPSADLPDILLVYQPFVASGIPTTGPWRNVPRCYVALATWEDEYAVRQTGNVVFRPWVPLLRRVRRRIEARMLGHADRIVVLSQFTRSRFQAVHRHVEHKFELIPGGVDIGRFRPASDRSSVKRALGLPLDRPVLLTVRNLEPRMGVENLLQAFRIVRQKHSAVALVIGGIGPLKERLRALAVTLGMEPHVRFVGYVSDEDLPRYYQAADLFVLPTVAHEGFGLVTVEALACGTPVLGTPVGATPEILGQLSTDFLTADATPSAIADGILRWLDRSDREAVQSRCRRLAEQRYAWQIVGAGLEHLMAGIGRKKSAGSFLGGATDFDDRASGIRMEEGGRSDRVRVLHFITRLDWGGSAQNTLASAIGQCARYGVTLVYGSVERVTGDERESIEKDLEEARQAGVRLIQLPSLQRSVGLRQDLRAFLEAWRLFRRERPTIVHTHTSKGGVVGRIAAWLAGVPIVVHTPHGHVFYGYFGRWTSCVIVWIERWLARSADRLIMLTEGERDDHRAAGVGRASQYRIVPSGIAVERFGRPAVEGAEARRQLGLPPRGPIVLFVGRLVPVKGVRTLVEAAPPILASHRETSIVLVGTGPLREDLAARAVELGVRDRVIFLGYRTDVATCLAAADVFVLPSLNEGMGRALVEAMTMGKPVVASRVSGIPTLVRDGDNGLLVPPGDARALAQAIGSLLDDPGLRERLGKAARSIAVRGHDVSTMTQRLIGIYDELLAAKGVR
jgi:glycosyltransferase involved in cell wall biosynthesis